MSNSPRHQENRLERAKLKQKENRIIRIAHHGGRFYKARVQELDVRKWFRWPAWLGRFWKWLTNCYKP